MKVYLRTDEKEWLAKSGLTMEQLIKEFRQLLYSYFEDACLRRQVALLNLRERPILCNAGHLLDNLRGLPPALRGQGITRQDGAANYPKVISMAESITNCTRCPAHLTRKNIVIQRGSEKPVTLFVGEAPGAVEDKQGLPFVGPSGKLLDQEIARIGIPPEHYAITNAVRCRPTTKRGYNRAPTPEEIENCRPFLQQQLDTMKPKVIVAVGRVAERALKEMDLAPIYVLHPAAVLRNPELKATMQRQMDKVRAVYQAAAPPAQQKATIWWW